MDVKRIKMLHESLSDDQLIDEYKYRMNQSTRMLGARETDMLLMIRKVIRELIAERGLKVTGS